MIKTVQILIVGILLLVWRYDRLTSDVVNTQKQLFQKDSTSLPLTAQAIVPEQISYFLSRKESSNNINLQVRQFASHSSANRLELTKGRIKAGHSL